MTVETIVSLITNNGAMVAMLIYLLIKDSKMSQANAELTMKNNEILNRVDETLKLIKSYILGVNDDDNK